MSPSEKSSILASTAKASSDLPSADSPSAETTETPEKGKVSKRYLDIGDLIVMTDIKIKFEATYRTKIAAYMLYDPTDWERVMAHKTQFHPHVR